MGANKSKMESRFQDVSFQRRALEQYFDNKVLLKNNRNSFSFVFEINRIANDRETIALLFLNNTLLLKYCSSNSEYEVSLYNTRGIFVPPCVNWEGLTKDCINIVEYPNLMTDIAQLCPSTA